MYRAAPLESEDSVSLEEEEDELDPGDKAGISVRPGLNTTDAAKSETYLPQSSPLTAIRMTSNDFDTLRTHSSVASGSCATRERPSKHMRRVEAEDSNRASL